MAVNLSPREVATYLRNFLTGQGGEWDWDDFTSIRIKDPFLEDIRMRCASLPDKFPPTKPGYYCSDEGLIELQRLLDSIHE